MISAKYYLLVKLFLCFIIISFKSFSFKSGSVYEAENKKDTIFNDSGNIKTSILYYEKLLESSRLTNDIERVTTAMSSLGKIYSGKGEYEKALEYLLNCIAIEKELNNDKKIADIYDILADIYNKSGNSGKALENFKKALVIYKELDCKNKIASTFNEIGLIYSKWEEYEKSLNYFQKSLDIKEKSGNKIGIANSYNNIAYIHYRWEDYQQAMEYNLKSLKIYEQLNIEKKKSDILNNMGLIYIETRNYDEALKFILKSLESEKKQNNKLGIAKSYNNIGLIYHKQGKLEKALEYYKKALSLTEQSGDMEQLAIGLSNIGTIHFHNNNINEAIKYLEKSRKIAIRGNYKRTLMYNYKSFSSAYSKLNDNKKALAYYKIYVAEKDSIFNKEKHKQISKLKILYETEKKEQEIKLLNSEKKIDLIKLKTQKNEIIFLSSGCVIILFLLILTFIQSSKRKKAYNDLVSKNIEIVKSEKKLLIAKEQIDSKFKIQATEINDIPNISNTNSEQIIISDKYEKSPIQENQKQELLDGIIDLMENKKCFLDKDISLEKMANYLNTNTKYISQIINENYNQNFSNFINEYRIKEARRLLTNPDYKKITIEGIAATVGFNSKSAFNISFKKTTGITPSFYQKSVSANV